MTITPYGRKSNESNLFHIVVVVVGVFAVVIDR